MKTHPIVPAALEFTDGPAPPYSPLFDDVYHARAGALAQAQHVFLQGNSLPQRWAGRSHFVILETGFGLGNNFLATWQAWRESPHRSQRLVFLSLEKHPLRLPDLRRAHQYSAVPELAQALTAAWPPLTANVHRLSFDLGQVQLLLAFGDIRDALRQWVAQVDAFYLDGFNPAHNPEMWDRATMKQLARLAAPGATLATWSCARPVREALSAAGFTLQRVPGFAHKRDMLVAHYAPRHLAKAPLASLRRPSGDRQALIIGAGLAGAATAYALHQQGWSATLLEGAAAPACGASGNPAGLFHALMHAQEGMYTRIHRAAALSAFNCVTAQRDLRQLRAQCDGLLRLDPEPDAATADALLRRLGLPDDFVGWLSASQASELAAVPLPSGAWHFRQAGWVDPRDYVRCLIAASGAQLRLGTALAQLEKHGSQWTARDAHGRLLGSASTVVVASGPGSMPWLQPWLANAGVRLETRRGQISLLDSGSSLHLRPPRIPVAGAGYAIGLDAQRLLCGATSHVGDDESNLRLHDHLQNLQQAQHLGVVGPQANLASLAASAHGRVGWRAHTADKLPLIGPLVDIRAMERMRQQGQRLDQVRFLPRWQDDRGGLYIFGALGSRGIAFAELGAQVLASWITGCPAPLEADLRDALDPARLLVRGERKKNLTSLPDGCDV